MISTIILLILYTLIRIFTYPLTLLPDMTFNESFHTGLVATGNYLANLNAVFPLVTLFTVLGFILVIEKASLAFKIINWLIRKIPFIN